MSDSDYTLPENTSRSSRGVTESVLLRPELTPVLEDLAHRHRRLVLLSLRENRLETTADLVGDVDGNTSELRIELEHRHLPKLADSGYIRWNRETGAIEKGEHFHEVEPFLRLIETHASELRLDRM